MTAPDDAVQRLAQMIRDCRGFGCSESERLAESLLQQGIKLPDPSPTTRLPVVSQRAIDVYIGATSCSYWPAAVERGLRAASLVMLEETLKAVSVLTPGATMPCIRFGENYVYANVLYRALTGQPWPWIREV